MRRDIQSQLGVCQQGSASCHVFFPNAAYSSQASLDNVRKFTCGDLRSVTPLSESQSESLRDTRAIQSERVV
ncbi:uncharacterized [Tachysurus ichikawai]